MKIITISREFGSGGRELGKRLADALGWDYYDREIIDRVAGAEGLDRGYVDRVLERPVLGRAPLTFGRSFSAAAYQSLRAGLLVREKEVIEGIARAGRDCVLVGRNADVYLRAQDPFTLFVCAAMSARIARCRQRERGREALSERELERSIRRIDRSRAAIRERLAGSAWGDPVSYCLTVNTTGWELKALAALVAAWARSWFARREEAAERADLAQDTERAFPEAGAGDGTPAKSPEAGAETGRFVRGS